MQKSFSASMRTAFFGIAVLASGLLLTQCASVREMQATRANRVYVSPSESMLLQVAPFDSSVQAVLVRSGLDPATLHADFTQELEYRFALRKQERALDSVAAQVVLTLSVRHLQPGVGATGAFATFDVMTNRDGAVQKTEWKWRRTSKANVPPAFVARDLSRSAVDEILKRIPARSPAPKEPPPPLELLR